MMCPPCTDEHTRWLDYQPPRPVRIASGAAYDDTPAGVRDRRRAWHDDRAATIRRQQALIVENCIAHHQTPGSAP